ncbi:MAG: aminoacetone oxidase family FAD-binding enzyme [Proteocatella sp.]
MEKYDIIIIGGGPAGMMAAIEAKKNESELNDSKPGYNNLRVGIIEKNPTLGKKLLITGGGRCNITNAQSMEVFHKNTVRNSKFLYSAFNNFTNKDLILFFENEGIKFKTEGKKIYPQNDNAQELLNVLVEKLEKSGVELILNSNVTNIEVKHREKPDGHGGCVIDIIQEGTLNSIITKKVIMATGGASYKSTGSDGSMFKLLENLGIKTKPLLPTLVKLNSNQEFITRSQGISLENIRITVKHNNKKVIEIQDSIVFTHNGISGPAAINSSSYITDKELSDVNIFIDLIPELPEEDFIKLIKVNDKKRLDTKISKLLPKELVKNIIETKIKPEMGIVIDEANKDGILEKDIQNMKKSEINIIVNSFKNLELKLTGYGGLNESIVTRGGVDTSEISPKNLSLKKYPDILISGEMIDIDALTGGFNLQIAFSTGYLAGKSARTF